MSVTQITRRQNRLVVAQASVVGFLPQRLLDLGFVENVVVTEKSTPVIYHFIVKIIVSPVLYTYSSVFLNGKGGNLVPQFGKAHSLQSTKVIKI
jgi:hypothetical protein